MQTLAVKEGEGKPNPWLFSAADCALSITFRSHPPQVLMKAAGLT